EPAPGHVNAAFFDSNGVFATEVQIVAGFPAFTFDIASNGNGFAAIVANINSVRVFVFDRNGGLLSQTSIAGAARDSATREVTIGSNGDDYLAVFTEQQHGIQAARVSEAGTASQAATLETAGIATAPAVAADGTTYTVGYVSSDEVRLLSVSRTLAATLVDTASAAPDARVSIVRRGDGDTISAWSGAPFGVVHLKLTGATGGAAEASFGAAEQQLLDTATSATTTLFVWYELANDAARLYAGARDVTGSWHERQLGTNLGTSALAASNGSEFMVIGKDDRDWLAWRVGASGDPIGQPSRFAAVGSATFNDIAWNGTQYVLAGVDSQHRIVAALLETNGRMSAPVVVREPRENDYLEKPSLASDGTNTLIAWSEILSVPCFPICDMAIDGINYRVLGPSLSLLGDSPRQLVDNDAGEPHAVFANGEYVVVWAQHDALRGGAAEISGARIDREGRRVDPVFTIAKERYGRDLEALSLGNRIAVSWRQSLDDNFRSLSTRVRIVRQNGSAISDATLPEQTANSARLTLLPDGRVAHATAMQQNAAPHHGASRIHLAVSDTIALPPRPAAPPRVLAIIDGLNVTLSWTPAPGKVNGYRIEYRISDGAWNELERWLGPDELSATIRLARTGVDIAFRVRAFNDAGAGSYAHSTGGAPRRRAVR
ncbi:MAG TPA: fibronectin type III domain-containing protein, partial [Thermoanaerobaculia bacterium]|nr:fibronectin type III domain-containing protein [Thermoanaerobaculia bacterium]